MSHRSPTLVLAAAALGALSCVTVHAGSPPVPDSPVALRVRTVEGESITLGSLRGRIVLVTLVASWADPALLELSRLDALLARYTADSVFRLCLVVDEQSVAAEILARTFDPKCLVAVPEDLPLLLGHTGPFGAIRVVPTSALLDRRGVIRALSAGAWPPEVLVAAIDQLLAEDRGSR